MFSRRNGAALDDRREGPFANPRDVTPDQCLIVRLGHGANCSSVGSVVDTLFVGATVGGAILAAVCAAMKHEPVTVVRQRPAKDSTVADGADKKSEST